MFFPSKSLGERSEQPQLRFPSIPRNYVNQLHWCNELTTAYLATSCDTAVADGYSNALWSERTQSQSPLGRVGESPRARPWRSHPDTDLSGTGIGLPGVAVIGPCIGIFAYIGPICRSMEYLRSGPGPLAIAPLPVSKNEVSPFWKMLEVSSWWFARFLVPCEPSFLDPTPFCSVPQNHPSPTAGAPGVIRRTGRGGADHGRFSGTDHLVVWPDVSFVDEERNETESSEARCAKREVSPWLIFGCCFSGLLGAGL